MSVNMRYIIRVIGFLFFFLGIGTIPPLIIALYTGEASSVRAFACSLVFCAVAGALILVFCKPSDRKLKNRDRILMVSLIWLVSAAVGAIPFMVSGAAPYLFDAFFEGASSISTTGATVLTQTESLGFSLLFWRSTLSWIGGLGACALASAILPPISVESQKVTSRDIPGVSLNGNFLTFSDTTRKLALLYLLLTGILIVILLACGMTPFEAFIHSFGTISTGGFSCYAGGIGVFHSPLISWVIIVFMIIAGINFNLYFILWKRGIRRMFRDEELRAYVQFIALFLVLIFLDLLTVEGSKEVPRVFTEAAFQTVSAITTTGWFICEYTAWPTFTGMLLLLLMMIGACSFSAGSGSRVVRILVTCKMARRGIHIRIHPNQVRLITLNDRSLPQETATNISNYMFFYITIIFAGAMIVAINGFDLITTMSAVISAVSNVGSGFGRIGALGNYSYFSGFSKFCLSILMIAGRLDLFAFFMLFSSHYWNSNKV